MKTVHLKKEKCLPFSPIHDASNLRHLELTGIKWPWDAAPGGQLTSQHYIVYSVACEVPDIVPSAQ